MHKEGFHIYRVLDRYGYARVYHFQAFHFPKVPIPRYWFPAVYALLAFIIIFYAAVSPPFPAHGVFSHSLIICFELWTIQIILSHIAPVFWTCHNVHHVFTCGGYAGFPYTLRCGGTEYNLARRFTRRNIKKPEWFSFVHIVRLVIPPSFGDDYKLAFNCTSEGFTWFS